MRKMVAGLVALTFLSGCGTIFESNSRQIPASNHRVCGVAGPTLFADGLLLLLGAIPGFLAIGTDALTGAMWYSDKECAARGYGEVR